MRKLEKEFNSDGFAFRQLDRQGAVAVYEKKKGDVVSFETVYIQERPEIRWPNGSITPEREVMPGNEQWGIFGFTYVDRSAAFKKMAYLQKHPLHKEGT